MGSADVIDAGLNAGSLSDTVYGPQLKVEREARLPAEGHAPPRRNIRRTFRTKQSVRLMQKGGHHEVDKWRLPRLNEPAQEALPRLGDFAEITCPTCGRFRITRTALEMIRGRDLDGRQFALTQAKRKALEGKIPVIDSYML
ncbi:hypothetical protein EME01_63780 [Sinorhizobium meliloti]|nr:hypothetical protein EME01_63780 [Sinorhizobium meliloti]